MQNAQKKPYKKYYAKSKTDNYEYDSFGHTSYQSNFHKPHPSYKYSKTKKYYNEYNAYQPTTTTNYVPSTKQDIQKKEQYVPQDKEIEHQEKWLHDKYTEQSDNLASDPNSTTNIDMAKSKGKNDKRPDKQLYSVRKKHAHGEDLNKSETNGLDTSEIHGQIEDLGLETGSSGPQTSSNDRAAKTNLEKSDQMSQTNALKNILRIGDEGHPVEEDKSFVSNVSTAISDKLKNHEEENGLSEKKAPIGERNQNYRTLPPSRILLEMLLESERGAETIRIFEHEENYEALLENICRNHHFSSRTGLYFKINILQILCDRIQDKSRVEPALKNLLNLNTKLIFCENGLQDVDDSIRPYLEVQPNIPPFWPDPVLTLHNMTRRNSNIQFLSHSANSL